VTSLIVGDTRDELWIFLLMMQHKEVRWYMSGSVEVDVLTACFGVFNPFPEGEELATDVRRIN
jgi:hypothetical protein